MVEAPSGPLHVELIPARHGDAILLTWGPEGKPHHLLIDGGPALAYPDVSKRMSELGDSPLDLLVLTHIDADHIEGPILLVNDAAVAIQVKGVWFNGPGQLSDELSAAQGEIFAALVGAREIPLNEAFEGGAVRSPDEGQLDSHSLDGGLTLTVLAPEGRSLRRLRDAWDSALQDEQLSFKTADDALAALKLRKNLVPEDPFLSDDEPPAADTVSDLASTVVATDTSIPNASSIVLLAEYAGRKVLLCGDATPNELTRAIRRLLDERCLERLELDALKMPHHGSARNITRDLLSLVPADHYLFSSDGGRFGHPDAVGVARCLAYGRPGAELLFNYASPQTLVWDDEDLLGGFAVRYPPGEAGISLALSASPGSPT